MRKMKLSDAHLWRNALLFTLLACAPAESSPPPYVFLGSSAVVTPNMQNADIPALLQQEIQKQLAILQPAEPSAPVDRLNKLPLFGQAAEPSRIDALSPQNRLMAAQILMGAELRILLKRRLRMRVATEQETSLAVEPLHIPSNRILSRPEITAICEKLHVSSIIQPVILKVSIINGVDRIATLFSNIIIYNNSNSRMAVITSFNIAGWSQISHVLFRKEYELSQMGALRGAAVKAASAAIHTMLTGQQSPFCNLSTELAILPVYSPSHADALLFTRTGSSVIKGVTDLEENASSFFHPNLLPLTGSQLLRENETEKILNHFHISADRLWIGEEDLNTGLLNKMAHSIHAGYLLAVHITEIEMQIGPSTKTDGSSAEACGVLTRIRDWKVLWRSRSRVNIQNNELLNNERSRKRLAYQAVRFVLANITDKLSLYFNSFCQ